MSSHLYQSREHVHILPHLHVLSRITVHRSIAVEAAQVRLELNCGSPSLQVFAFREIAASLILLPCKNKHGRSGSSRGYALKLTMWQTQLLSESKLRYGLCQWTSGILGEFVSGRQVIKTSIMYLTCISITRAQSTLSQAVPLQSPRPANRIA